MLICIFQVPSKQHDCFNVLFSIGVNQKQANSKQLKYERCSNMKYIILDNYYLKHIFRDMF